MLRKYLLQLLYITLALAAATLLLSTWLPEGWQTNGWIGALMLFYILGAAFFVYLQKVTHKKQHAFANFFLLSTGVKLLVYMAYIVVYLWFNKAEARIFLLLFLAYYTVFAVFESRIAMRMQQKN